MQLTAATHPTELTQLCKELLAKGQITSSDIQRVNQAIKADQSEEGIEALGVLMDALIEGRISTTSPTARMYLSRKSQLQAIIQQVIRTGLLDTGSYRQISHLLWLFPTTLTDTDRSAMGQLAELLQTGQIQTEVAEILLMLNPPPARAA